MQVYDLLKCAYENTLFLSDSWQATKIKIDPAHQPSFISSSQVFKVKDQDTVVLPCEVANSGKYLANQFNQC